MAKPDQLIKRRGKLGLIKAGVDFEGAKKWLTEMIGKEIQVSGIGNYIFCFDDWVIYTPTPTRMWIHSQVVMAYHSVEIL